MSGDDRRRREDSSQISMLREEARSNRERTTREMWVIMLAVMEREEGAKEDGVTHNFLLQFSSSSRLNSAFRTRMESRPARTLARSCSLAWPLTRTPSPTHQKLSSFLARPPAKSFAFTGMSASQGYHRSDNAEAYRSNASFVYSSAYTAAVLQLLDPQPGDKVLDLGCGTCYASTVTHDIQSSPASYLLDCLQEVES